MEHTIKKILFIEDDKIDCMAFERFAAREQFPYQYVIARSVKETRTILNTTRFDAVVTDYLLGDGTAFDLFEALQGSPIIIVTGTGDEEIAVNAMKSGAYDYLIKDPEGHHLKTLAVTIENALKRKQAEVELQRYREHLEELVEERTIELKTTNELLQQEINERKQAEESLQNLVTAVETMPLGLTITDLHGKIIYTNPTEAKMHGYRVEDLLGLDLGIFAPPDLRRPVTLEDISQRRGLVRESVNIRKDGSRFPVWLMSEIVRDPHGNPYAIVTSCEDITARKHAEEELRKHRDHLEDLIEERTVELHYEIEEHTRTEAALRAMKQRYDLAVSAGRVSVWEYDFTTEALLLDPEIDPIFKDLLGYELHERPINKTTWIEYIHPDDQLMIETALQTAMEGKTPHYETEYRMLHQDGSVRWVSTRAETILDKKKKPARMIGTIMDITTRKHNELELQEAKEVADTANQAKSAFLANMSHEIRTPMNAILGFAQILQEQLREYPHYQEYLTKIITSGNSLLRLLDDILDLSKIEAGRLEIRPESLTLPALLSEIQQMFALRAQEKGLRLETYLGLDTPATVLLDGTRVRQMLINLVGNAVKFTHAGSITLAALTDAQQEPIGKTVDLLFEVRDTGIGMTPEDQALVFDPFQQVGETRGKFGGTGLGLTITRRLVELMYGSITVHSEPNQGTTFTIRLPQVTVITMQPALSDKTDQRTVNIQFHGATILVVEDNALNREVIRGFLASHHLRLIEAEHGQEALQILTRTRPDLILMDIQMPVMDGNTATQHIRNSTSEIRNIPIIALTAYAMKDQRTKFQELYEAYVTKPVIKDELIKTLAALLPHTKIAPQKEEQMGAEEPSSQVLTERVSTQPGLLREIHAYIAHAEGIPQDLLDTLRNELLPRQQELSEVLSADELLDFAETVLDMGQHFLIPPLQDYGEELLQVTKVFDITSMKRLLALFPEIVKIIATKARRHEENA